METSPSTPDAVRQTNGILSHDYAPDGTMGYAFDKQAPKEARPLRTDTRAREETESIRLSRARSEELNCRATSIYGLNY